MNSSSGLFKWKHFEAEIILLTVRWYLQYRLSYRDLVEMMSERGRKGQVKLKNLSASNNVQLFNHLFGLMASIITSRYM
jgi:hypothetical protein